MIKQVGFTLIELLLTTLILLATLSLAMFGYRFYTEQWSRNLSQIEDAYDRYRLNALVNNALHGIVPYLVNRGKGVGFYFLGRSDGFTAVTQAPVFNTASSAVIRVFAESDNEGTYNLIYEEASLQSVFLVDAEQKLPFNRRIIVEKGVPSIKFNYYAASTTMEPGLVDGVGAMLERKWFNQYDGLSMAYHPESLSIDIGGYMLYTTIADRATILKNRSEVQSD